MPAYCLLLNVQRNYKVDYVVIVQCVRRKFISIVAFNYRISIHKQIVNGMASVDEIDEILQVSVHTLLFFLTNSLLNL